jgi:hypothetical protein
MGIIDLKDKKNDSIQLWEESFHAFGKKLLADIDAAENSDSTRKRKRAHAGFAELDGGQTLLVDFLEKKGFKGFVEAVRIDAEDREVYGEEILDEMPNLEDCLKVLSYEDLEGKFLELEPEEQGGSYNKDDKKKDEEDKPSRRGKKEEAEEETPTRRRGKAAEEEVADEPPPRRRGAKVEEGVAEEKPTRRRGATPEPEMEEEVEPPTRSSRRSKPEPEPEVEEEAPAPSRRARGVAVEEEKPAGKCFVKGGVFGKDCNKHVAEAPEPNCYDCPEETYRECEAAMNK